MKRNIRLRKLSKCIAETVMSIVSSAKKRISSKFLQFFTIYLIKHFEVVFVIIYIN